MRKCEQAFVMAAVALVTTAALVGLGSIGIAEAKITCENPGGNEPPGNQGKDKCNGPALENKNPAGNTPEG